MKDELIKLLYVVEKGIKDNTLDVKMWCGKDTVKFTIHLRKDIEIELSKCNVFVEFVKASIKMDDTVVLECSIFEDGYPVIVTMYDEVEEYYLNNETTMKSKKLKKVMSKLDIDVDEDEINSLKEKFEADPKEDDEKLMTRDSKGRLYDNVAATVAGMYGFKVNLDEPVEESVPINEEEIKYTEGPVVTNKDIKNIKKKIIKYIKKLKFWR